MYELKYITFIYFYLIILFFHFLLFTIRETKLVEKANKHIYNTAQRFDDENALMSSCFYNLEDDIYEYERHAARLHQLKNALYINSISKLNHISELETKTRTNEDIEVLDTLIETQTLLQQTVSIHFIIYILLLLL